MVTRHKSSGKVDGGWVIVIGMFVVVYLLFFRGGCGGGGSSSRSQYGGPPGGAPAGGYSSQPVQPAPQPYAEPSAGDAGQRDAYGAVVAQAMQAQQQADAYAREVYGLQDAIQSRINTTPDGALADLGIGENSGISVENQRDRRQMIVVADAAVKWYGEAARLYRQAGQTTTAGSCDRAAQDAIDACKAVPGYK